MIVHARLKAAGLCATADVHAAYRLGISDFANMAEWDSGQIPRIEKCVEIIAEEALAAKCGNRGELLK